MQKAEAQVRVGVDINVGAQPDWGPYGYDYAQFYYFPDIDVYYDIASQQFVYFDGYDWRYSPYLPSLYNGFDLYGAYKVVINEPRPFLRADYYRRQYYGYRGYHNQPVLRDYRHRDFDERRNEGFDEHRNGGFEQRGERYEERSGRVEDHDRNFEQQDNRRFQQLDNRPLEQQSTDRGFERRGNENNTQRTYGNNQGVFNGRATERMSGNDRGWRGGR